VGGLLVRLRFLLAFLCGWLLPATALAQSITIQTQIDHSIEHEGDINEIYYEECIGNGTVTIPFTLVSPGDDDLWVWAGITSCENDDTRSENLGGRCRDLGRLDNERNAELRVRDILLPALPSGSTPDEVCTALSKGSVSVFLMLMDGPTRTVSSAKVDFNFDFEGPSAPEIDRVGIGEEQLFVRWDASGASDIDGYYVFCEAVAPEGSAPASGGASSTGGATATSGASAGGASAAGGAGTGATSAEGGAPDAEGGAPDAEGGTTAAGGTTAGGATAGGATAGGATAGGATAGGATVGGATAAGGTTASQAGNSSGGGATSSSGGSTGPVFGGSGNCRTTRLIPGSRPPADGVYRSRKYSRTATSGGSAELENFVRYACAVAGIDSKGNVGNLSDVECATPEPVTDFFEAYDRAGGRGGGGFCAFGSSRSNYGFLVIGLGAALLALRYQRRGSSS
jgi:hypothetical protein